MYQTQQPNLQINNYHATNIKLSHSNPKWDVYTLNKVKNLLLIMQNKKKMRIL